MAATGGGAQERRHTGRETRRGILSSTLVAVSIFAWIFSSLFSDMDLSFDLCIPALGSGTVCLHGRAAVCMCVCVSVRVYVCRYLGSRAVDGRGPKHRLVELPCNNERK